MQRPYPIITLPRVIVWTIAALVGFIAYLIHRWRIQRPIYKEESSEFSGKKTGILKE